MSYNTTKKIGIELSWNVRQALAIAELASGKIAPFTIELASKVDAGLMTADEAIRVIEKIEQEDVEL